MSLTVPLTLYRYESRVLTGTVIDPAVADALVNLTTARGGVSTLEFEVKVRPGAADPALIHKALGSGVAILTQSGATLGQYTVTLVPADFTSVPGGMYWLDVCAVFADATRQYLVKPQTVFVKDVVNPT